MAEGYVDRIISKKEIGKLKDLLLDQNLDYPNYSKWVENTAEEINAGKRYAFGLFDERLCGDGVIRKTASGTVELKNFYLIPDCRKKGLGSELLSSIEDFCIERGFSQMQVDVYISESKTVIFFLKNGFEFQSRGDFYGSGKDSYLLVKKLPKKYIGEYDWISISKWVFETLWNFRLERELEYRCLIYNKSDRGMNITATAKIDEAFDKTIDEIDLQKFKESEYAKGVLFYFAQQFAGDAKIYANEIGMTVIDHDELEKLSSFNLPKSQEDIAGLIVIIKPEFFEALKEKNDRVYIKGGQAPPGITPGKIIIFYVIDPIMGIKGYAKIMGIDSGAPHEIWAKHSRQSAFSDEEYMTYTRGKSIVTAYSIEEIKETCQTLELEKIRSSLGTFNHQAGQRITVSQWGTLAESIR